MMDLGSMPSGWKTVKLGDVSRDFVSGGTPTTKEVGYWDGAIPWTTSAPISEDGVSLDRAQRCITEEALRKSASHLVPKGNLLIGTRVGVGKAVVNLIDVAISQDLTGVVLDHTVVDAEFIAYQFKTRRIQGFLDGRKRGTTIQGVSRFDLESVVLQSPPLPEQRAIAHVLRTVQQAREARQREIELERARKAALMQHLFTHGARGEPGKQTEIGEMPESWQVVRLGDRLRERVKNGHSAQATNTMEGVRTLTLSAVTRRDFSFENTKLTVADPAKGPPGNKGINYPPVSSVDSAKNWDVYPLTPPKVKDLWLQPGDIFVERANTLEFVGLAALYNGPTDFAIYPDLMTRVRVKEDEVDPHFAIEFLLTDVCRRYFRKNATGTAGNMPKIDHGVVNRTLIPWPDLGEQQQIASVAEACDAKITALERESALLDETFRSLLEELMTGRLSVLPSVATIVEVG